MEKKNGTCETYLCVINHNGRDYFYLGGRDFEDRETGEVIQIHGILNTTPENFKGFYIYKKKL
jgi:hypothetical protein